MQLYSSIHSICLTWLHGLVGSLHKPKAWNLSNVVMVRVADFNGNLKDHLRDNSSLISLHSTCGKATFGVERTPKILHKIWALMDVLH